MSAPSPFTADSRWFVQLGGDVRGPLTPDALRQLGEVEVLTLDTPVAAAPEGPWQALSAWPEGASLLPAKRTFRLTPPPPPGPEAGVSTGISVKESFLAAAAPLGHLTGEQAKVSPPLSSGPAEDVVAMVREVAAIDARLAGERPLDLRPRSRRRLHHYLVLLVLGNAVLTAIPLWYGGPFDEFVLLILASWYLLYNAGLWMIMFLYVPKY